MRIKLLGTGAADGIPAIYSDSEVSHYARLHGGKDLRSRSAALVDGHLQLDLPPDTFFQLAREGIDARKWSAILFTHSHDDHFAPTELQYALYPFNPYEYAGFAVFGNDEIIRRIEALYPDWPFELFKTKSFEPFKFAGYTITPIHAHHKLDEDSHNLIIEDGKRVLLYGTDTGIWFEETWDFLKGIKLDALVIECTEGFVPTAYTGHLDITDCLGVVARLREQGTLRPSSKVVTTHHSHNGNATHCQLEETLRPKGIEPGYDGMEFSF